MSSGKPGEFIVDDDADPYSSLVTSKVEGAPLDIQSLCNASSCSLEEEDETTTITTIEQRRDDDDGGGGGEWNFDSATFSLIVLSGLTGVFLLLSCCACIPYVTQQSHANADQQQQQQQPYYSYGRQSTEDSGTQQVLEFRHISRTVILRPDAAKAYGQKEKQILNNISSSMASGTVTAIMGPSGAGKSTLLNVIAAVGHGGSSSSSRVSGQILLNGKQQPSGYRKKVAYVTDIEDDDDEMEEQTPTCQQSQESIAHMNRLMNLRNKVLQNRDQ